MSQHPHERWATKRLGTGAGAPGMLLMRSYAWLCARSMLSICRAQPATCGGQPGSWPAPSGSARWAAAGQGSCRCCVQDEACQRSAEEPHLACGPTGRRQPGPHLCDAAWREGAVDVARKAGHPCKRAGTLPRGLGLGGWWQRWRGMAPRAACLPHLRRCQGLPEAPTRTPGPQYRTPVLAAGAMQCLLPAPRACCTPGCPPGSLKVAQYLTWSPKAR